MDLRARWLALGGDDATFDDVLARYAEPHRAYHTIHHIEHVLAKIDEIRGSSDDTTDPAVALAAVLHDVIYDPRRDDNESRSAEYATDTLTALGIRADVVARTADLIRATEVHDGPPGDDGLDALLDADLSSFADDNEGRNGELIRHEYAFVPEDAFLAGRRRILERFLAREPLYRTQYMSDRYEAKAKANIRRALERINPS